MDRYITRRYVALSEAEAHRLAEIDRTPADEIRLTQNVEPVHVQTSGVSWVLWSDGKFTTRTGTDLAAGGSLSKDAVRLISLCRESDTGSVEGGLALLTKVKRILGEATVEQGPSRGYYHRETINRFDIEWLDGSQSPLYEHSAGYSEGYAFELYGSLESLRAGLQPPVPESGITDPQELERRGYRYDPELGYVKPESDA